MIYLALLQSNSQSMELDEGEKQYLIWSLVGSCVIVSALIVSFLHIATSSKRIIHLKLSLIGLFVGQCFLCVGVAFDIDHNNVQAFFLISPSIVM